MEQANVPQFGTNKKIARGETVMPWRSFTVALTVFILILIAYAGLSFGYKPFLENSISDLEKKTAELDSRAPDSEKEGNFITFYSQVTNVKGLLEGHKSMAGIIELLETRTLPDVAWETVKISAAERSIALNGVAKDYSITAEQLGLLGVSDVVTRLNIGNLKYTDTGIRFDTKANLNFDIFSAAKNGFNIISEKNAAVTPPNTQTNSPAVQGGTQTSGTTR